MFETKAREYANKIEQFQDINSQLSGLIEGETDIIANLANGAALLFQMLGSVNWAGFYLYKNGELVVGPFCGKPACVRIALGRGVCGTAAETRVTQVVPDVFEFPGHIACDGASRSEIVIPIVVDGELFGVLDVDSPELARFDFEDEQGLSRFVAILSETLRTGR